MSNKTCDWCEAPRRDLEWRAEEVWVEEEDPRTGKIHYGWREVSGWFCPDDREEQRFCWHEYIKAMGGVV